MAFSNGPLIVTNGLILALDASDQNSYVSGSTTWTSLVGSYNGSLIQSCSFSQGPPQTFTNNITLVTQTAYLSMTPELQLFDQTNYTLDFWVKLRSGNVSTLHSLVGWGSTSPWILLDVSANDGSVWQVKFRDLSAAYNNFSSVSNYNISSNWANITLTADTSRNLSFYLNGTFRETIVLTNSFMRITRIMGGYQSGGNGYNLQGSMSSTKFYNAALSAAEIQQNYNALKSRFNLT
jgi:hypothetical protein